MRLDHCCLNVRDMDAAIAFYTEQIGLTLASRRHVEKTNAEIAFLTDGESDMRLELTHWRDWSADEYTEGSQFDHIALTCRDVRAEVERLRAAGVKVAMEPFEMGGSGTVIAFVHDVDGNWVELVERRS